MQIYRLRISARYQSQQFLARVSLIQQEAMQEVGQPRCPHREGEALAEEGEGAALWRIGRDRAHETRSLQNHKYACEGKATPAISTPH